MVVCAISLVAFINSTNLSSFDSKSLIAFGQILSIGASAKFLFYLLQKDKEHTSSLQHGRGLTIPINLIGVGVAIFLKTYATKFSQDLHTVLLVDSIAYAVGAFSVAAFVSTMEHSFEKHRKSCPRI
jgi:peptidoglycan biosynthesis protein MviN/MurJ (putative lipid II flippase)